MEARLSGVDHATSQARGRVQTAPRRLLSSEAPARLGDDPEDVGARVRDALVGGTAPPRGDDYAFLTFWHAAVENAGALVFQAQAVDVDEMRGFSISERPLPAVILNIKDAPTARCFSLMHELAHVMLDRGGLCLFEETGPRTEIQRTEVFCNHVAGAALLPAESLLRNSPD